MASVFKRGSETNYTISYFDANGVRRDKSARTSDYRAAERIAAKIEADVALRRDGVVDARHDRYAEEKRKPLSAHVADYMQHCAHVGQAAVTISEKVRHLAWLLSDGQRTALLNDAPKAARKTKRGKAKPAIDKRSSIVGPGWDWLSDMNAERLEQSLALLHESGRSARTCNYKRESAIAFGNWLVRSGRMESNPLRLVHRLDAGRDQRRVRRALTEDEIARLFKVAESRGRKLWYMLAALAGLRRSEIADLRWSDVDLAAGSLTIARGKAKRSDVLPLHADLVTEFAKVRPQHVLPTARVFAEEITNETRQHDFERAGIALVDETGAFADLHSLRTTLGTRLARAGIAPQIAMRLMRHSDYRLTLKHYTRLTLDDSAAALASLPMIQESAPHDDSAQATGTDGAQANADALQGCPQKRPQSVHEAARERTSSRESAHAEREDEHARNSAFGATLRDATQRQAWCTRRDSNTQQPVPKTGDTPRKCAVGQRLTSTFSAEPAETPAVSRGSGPETDEELREVVERWSTLPDTVRKSLLAIVRALPSGTRER